MPRTNKTDAEVMRERSVRWCMIKNPMATKSIITVIAGVTVRE